jgi:hypothetical protein
MFVRTALRSLTVASLLVVAGCSASGKETAPEAAPPAAATPAPVKQPTQEEMMAAWKQYATPTDAHKTLRQLVGNFKYTMTMWQHPGAQPEKTTGTSKNKMMFDRFLVQEVKGKVMGKPFEGMGVLGFDTLKNQIVSSWIDNMGTGMMTSTGSLDTATKTVSEQGTFTCPMTADHVRKFRGAMTITDKNRYTYEMFHTGPDGAEFKSMSIEYTRK